MTQIINRHNSYAVVAGSIKPSQYVAIEHFWMSHMFATEITALLRRILDDVCGDVSIGDSGIKARVASRLLECAAKGDVSVEGLQAAARCALEEARAT
jgi:hypothetical protein